MRMSSEGSKLWEKIETDKKLVSGTIRLAERDLKASEAVFKNGDYDWSFAISYNAMLQAGRALMFAKGFRPKGEHKHIAVVEFVRENFGGQFADRLLFIFDKSRKKRHMVVYEAADIITKDEAEVALAVAEEFVEKVRGLLKNAM
jgi:uncharacterized protein (UPF0332 family)